MDFSEYKIGEQDKVIHLDTMDDNRSAVTTLAQQCHRSLHIQSYDLDPIIYDTAEFIEAVRQIAVNSTRANIRILVEDTRKIIAHGHRIIELTRQLTSFMEIRKINTEIKTLPDAFLIADETALVYRKQTHRYEGFVNFNDRGHCRQLLANFKDSWEKAASDAELRRLHL